jgi:hypothetical protein
LPDEKALYSAWMTQGYPWRAMEIVLLINFPIVRVQVELKDLERQRRTGRYLTKSVSMGLIETNSI